MIRILLVDDQNIMRQGLQAIIEPKSNLEVVGMATDGNSAIKQVEILKPDIVLMDIEMPKMTGITATQEICQQFPKTKILVLSSHESQKYVTQALQAGAVGYLLKSTLAEDLEQAIWSVYRGHSQIESKLLKKVLAGVSVAQSTLPVKQSRSTSITKAVPETSLQLRSANIDDLYLRKVGENTLTSNDRSSSLALKPLLKNHNCSEFEQSLPENPESAINNSPSDRASKKPFPDLTAEKEVKSKETQKSLKKIKWWTIALAVVPVLFIMAITLVHSRTSKTSSLAVTETQNIPKAIAAIGYLEPQGEVIKVSAPAFLEGARVKKLLVKRGERIDTEQTIAILDNQPRLQAALEEAQKQVQVSRSRLAQVKAGAKKGDIQAQNAKFEATKAELTGQINSQTANIANLEAQLEGQTNSQQATIARLKAELDNATKECQRYESLFTDGAIAASENDRICLQQKTTQEQLQAAEINLTEIEATLQQKISEAGANLDRTQATLANQINEAKSSLEAISEVRSVDVAVAKTELETAEAAANKAQADLDLAYIKSPISGQILEINTLAGEIVDNTDGIVSLGNTKNMYVVAEVYETDIDRIRIGQSATITSDGITKKLTGTVDDVGLQIGTKDVLGTDPVSDSDARVVEVKIRLNAEDSKRVASLTNLQVNAVIDTSQDGEPITSNSSQK